MPTNGMNTGVDYQLLYYNGRTGSLVELGDVQTIRVTAQKHDLKTLPYNDVPRYGFVPDGFRVDFTMTRSTSDLEDFMVDFSTNFNAGRVIAPGYLNENINNADGSVSRYQYTNFVAFLTDHGDISREKVVTLRLEGFASDKIRIA